MLPAAETKALSRTAPASPASRAANSAAARVIAVRTEPCASSRTSPAAVGRTGRRSINLSATHGVNFFLKREDMAGPGTLSGSKTRLAEFIIGQALGEGVTHVISQGVYLTNSGMQFATACRVAGLTPILYLTRDENRHGELT
ncbi:hypothetical protein [Streptomyces sp. 6N106]|uniref:hypothetical protein n=1 Tax=Streptomyces sp. 6N106 TaxID=3457418 RepID=UPI003FD4495F